MFLKMIRRKKMSMNDDAVSQELALDVTAEEARALHRVVRAMHDGHCPKCGHLGSADEFYYPALTRLDPATVKEGHHMCPKCAFVVTDAEAAAALQQFQPYLIKSVEIFDCWRTTRLSSDVSELVDEQ